MSVQPGERGRPRAPVEVLMADARTITAPRTSRFFAEIGEDNYDEAADLLETLMQMVGTAPQGVLRDAIEELSGRISRYEATLAV